ncbi:MAG: ABC transporter ATP-binding protein [Acidimicrobiales bacterium]
MTNGNHAVPSAEIPAVEVRKLRKTYGSVVAVNDIDLSVVQGEILGLLGPNGAGKTTTGGMITTRILPTSGQALVGGIDVVAHPAEARRRLGVVPQSNTLDRSLTVAQNLYFHGRYFGMKRQAAREKTDELLASFRLSERANAPVMALSGGMAQRLMLARAIMHDPTVLVLDEPTSGLDPQSRLALWDILQEINTRGQSVLLTTHYMEEADSLCDRIAIMDHGQILALDTPDGLKRTYGGSSELRVSASGDGTELRDALIKALDDRYSVLATSTGLTISGPDVAGIASTTVITAEQLGRHVTDLAVTDPTLETVFISLTGRELRD